MVKIIKFIQYILAAIFIVLSLILLLPIGLLNYIFDEKSIYQKGK